MQSDLAPIADASRWPAQFSAITSYAMDEALRVFPGLEVHKVRLLSVHITARLAREFGGTAFYIPKSDAIDRALRDLSIWAEHDGTVEGRHGVNAIARRYKISSQTVWSILKRQRALLQSHTHTETKG